MADVRKSRFGSDISELNLAPCLTCARKSPFGPSCAAFPRGIPLAILTGENDHRLPVEGDQGLRYVKEEEG